MCRLLAAIVVLGAMWGCRDLALPEVNSLSIEAPRDVVAPRQKLQLTAVSGAPPYVFSFAPNGKNSGELASISADGSYQAGERGLTQDTIRVTDSLGSTAVVLLTVGAPLSLTPPLSVVAPGGRVRFVAAGGLPPWKISRADGGEIAGGDYQATDPGDRVEEITLTDATADPAAVARAQVSIGNEVVVFPGRSRVAPRERIGFVALGGQPPYTFSIGASSNSGGLTNPTVDPQTGEYFAGSNDAAAMAVDVIVVTDVNGESTTARVEVGLPLRLEYPAQTAHPGVPLQLEATGGRPPYTFAFLSRGNRSRGLVDSIGGDYTPGPNTGAIDLLEVTDVTGSTARATPILVGALQLEIPIGGAQMSVADFDGNGAPDLAFLWVNEFVSVIDPGKLTQSVQRTYLSTAFDSLSVQLVPYDYDLDGRSDLYVPSRASHRSLRARVGGRFDLFEQTDGTVWGAARGTLIAGDFFHWRRAGCLGIERVTVSTLAVGDPDGGLALPDAGCAFPNTGDLFSVAGNEGVTGPRWLSWFVLAPRAAGELSRSVLPMEMRYLDANLNVTRSAQLPIPSGFRLTERARVSSINQTPNGVNMILDQDRAVGPNRMLVLADELDAGVSRFWGIDTTGPSTLFMSDVVPTPFPAAGMAGSVDSLGTARLAAWDTRTGRVPVFGLNDAGVAHTQNLDVAYPVTSAAFIDLDDNGEGELVTSSIFSSRADVFWSDATGTFGRRARFNVGSWLTLQPVDLDRDGTTDLISSASNAIVTSFGVPGERQLAVGPSSPMPVNPDRIFVAELTGDLREDLFFRDDQGAMWVSVGAGPAAMFAPPQPVLNPQGQQDVSITGPLLAADFGGSATGPDLLTSARDPISTQVVAMIVVRTGLATATQRFLPLPPGPLAGRCEYTSMQLDGVGPEEIVAGCFANTGVAAYAVARATGSGATITFPSWQSVTVPPAMVEESYAVPAPPGDARRFMLVGDQFVVLSAAGGNLSLTLHQLPVLSIVGLLVPVRAQQAEPDLVIVDEGTLQTVMLGWNGTTWVEHKRIGALGAPLWPQQISAGAAPDVLVGDFTNSIVTFLENDAGTLF